jgi:hypothetical protein
LHDEILCIKMDMRNEKDAQVIYASFIHILVAGAGFEPTDTSITVPRYTPRAPRRETGLAGTQTSSTTFSQIGSRVEKTRVICYSARYRDSTKEITC